MRMAEGRARRLFAAARVARLATRTAEQPRIVPIVFAVIGDRVYTAVDQKPKRSKQLARLRDIEGHAGVSLLADRYDEDWSALWWVRADGTASVHEDDDNATEGLASLTDKYPQYRTAPPTGPVIRVDVERWTGWQAAGGSS